MAAVFKNIGGIIYWLVIYLTADFTPQIDNDFIVVNTQFRPFPLYYVTDNQKLYILLENPVKAPKIGDFVLYLTDNMTDQVLINGQINLPQTESTRFAISDYIDEYTVEFPPTKNITEVLSANIYNFTSEIREKFIQKYPFTQNYSTILPFPPLTNG
nr:Putative helicase/primase complex protein [Abalone asfa-like virus]